MDGQLYLLHLLQEAQPSSDCCLAGASLVSGRRKFHTGCRMMVFGCCSSGPCLVAPPGHSHAVGCPQYRWLSLSSRHLQRQRHSCPDRGSLRTETGKIRTACFLDTAAALRDMRCHRTLIGPTGRRAIDLDECGMP